MSNSVVPKLQCLDFVFCLDNSEAMKPYFKDTRDFIIRLCSNALKSFSSKGWLIKAPRARLVFFKNDEENGTSVKESEFFDISCEEERLLGFFDKEFNPSGAQGLDQNGFDALECAMMSDWTVFPRGRQIIILISGTSALKRDKEGMDRLLDKWLLDNTTMPNHRLIQRQKRLILIAPSSSNYLELAEEFDRTVFEAIDYNDGGLGAINLSYIFTQF